MPTNSDQTRERIVAAAARLFYNEGIRAACVDAIAEKAGITKKTLYYHFRSKDELIAAYLESRDQPTLDLYARWFEAVPGSAADKVRGLFAEFATRCNGKAAAFCVPLPNWPALPDIQRSKPAPRTRNALRRGLRTPSPARAPLTRPLPREALSCCSMVPRR